MPTIIIKWVLALSEYFFSRETEDQVFLYIDKQILDQIGDKNGIGNHNDFTSTFLVFEREDRIRIYDEFFRHKTRYYPNRTPADNRRIYTPNILNFALFLAERLGYPYYFPYVALAMYFASNARLDEQAIGLFLKQQFQIRNYVPIADLFDRLSTDQPAFKNKRKTQERIIGLIKYQLILSPSETNEIKEALNRISYVEDCNHSYSDVIRRIRDFVSLPVKDILIHSLSEQDYQNRIKDILNRFDLESYRREHQGCTALSREEEFALLLVVSREKGRGFRLLSSYRPRESVSLDNDGIRFSFTPSIDRIEDYNDEYVRINDTIIVDLKRYELKADGLKIRPLPLGDLVFFYKYDEGRYLQSRKAYVGRRVYIFVKNNAIDRWEAWAKDHARNCHRKDLVLDVSCLTQGNWALYLADGLNASYFEAEDHLTNTVREISKRGGLKFPREKDVYLMNALPYFEFPMTIQRQGLTVVVNRDGVKLKEEEHYRIYINNKRLFIDIFENNNCRESKEIKVCIKYVDPDTGDELDTDNDFEGDPVFYIRGQSINYCQEGLYQFNRWGDITMEAEIPRIQGNQIVGIEECLLGNIKHSIDDLQDFDAVPAQSFYFINLLSSCFYMAESGQITKERLKDCIEYAFIRLGAEENREKVVERLVGLLGNCGYLSADYGTSHYQAIPPAFLRIPRTFNPGEFLQLWMLTGAYTRLFLNDLVCFCKDRGLQLKLRYNDNPDLSRSERKLLPPILLIDARFDPKEFKKKYGYHCFDIKADVDQSLGLLSLVPSISNYRQTLTRIPRESFSKALMEPISCEFPRIRWDNPNRYNRHYYIEEAEGKDFLKPSVSENWNDLYCHYTKQSPYIICGKEYIYLPAGLCLPSLIQRSLFIMNVGEPSFQKAFVCDMPSGLLYEPMKVYKVNAERSALLLNRLTGTGAEDNPKIRSKTETKFGDRKIGAVHCMELWKINEEVELDDSLPNELMVLMYKDNLSQQIVAVSTSYQDTYVMREGRLLKVTPDCNSMMSQILNKPSWQYADVAFTNDPVEFRMPERNHYKTETITIL